MFRDLVKIEKDIQVHPETIPFMKRVFSIASVILLLLFAASCNDAPVVRPGLSLAKGQTWNVEFDVDIASNFDMAMLAANDEKQKFTAGYTWEVLDVLDDTMYVIGSTITGLKIHTKMDQDFQDYIVLTDNDSAGAPAPVQHVDVAEIAKGMVGRDFQFTITKGGEVQSVLGADSAIYETFVTAYKDASDTLFRSDYYLVKSFCGNNAFARLVDQLFAPFNAPEGWQANEEFENNSKVTEELESMDQSVTFISRNNWKCQGPGKTGYGLSLVGEFANRKERRRNIIDAGMAVKGNQEGTFSYDTTTFFPRSVKLKQQYTISTGMGAGPFSFQLSSFRVQRNVNFAVKE